MIRIKITAAVLAIILLSACATAPESPFDRNQLEGLATATVERMKNLDPASDARFFQTAKGYAVFPAIGKGAVGFGGAYGRGVLYENGKIIGYCDITEGSIGAQIGGQSYSEIIFFGTNSSLLEFKAGTLEFAAGASAVIAAADASTTANYDRGVAVFTLGGKGAMAEAAIGAQKFTYVMKP